MNPRRKMRLTVEIQSRQEAGHRHRVGTEGIVVDPLGPNAWLVEVRVPDATLEGDAWYETLEVYWNEFELVEEPVDWSIAPR